MTIIKHLAVILNPKLTGALSLGLVLALALACNFTTANISRVVLSPNDDGSAPTNTFRPDATVHAIVTISNVGPRTSVRSRLYFENVAGTEANEMVPGSERMVNLERGGEAAFNYWRTGGMPPGTYRIEITLLYEGEQKDQESVTFTVS